jgi:hypothetical protein
VTTKLPYQKHSVTSEAAAQYATAFANGARGKVFLYIVENLGVTDEEISLGLDMNPSTVRPRRGELEKHGLIVPHSLKKTLSGCEAVSYAVVPGVAYPAKWPTAAALSKDPEKLFLGRCRALGVVYQESGASADTIQERLWEAFLELLGEEPEAEAADIFEVMLSMQPRS